MYWSNNYLYKLFCNLAGHKRQNDEMLEGCTTSKQMRFGEKYMYYIYLSFPSRYYILLLEEPQSKVIDLRKENWRSIELIFGELTSSIKESLERRNVRPKELVNCLHGCFHDDKVLKDGGEKMFFQAKEECEECSSFTDFWSTISGYFTFYSYKFLKVIANSKYGTVQDKEKFERYEKYFMSYSKEVVSRYTSDLELSKSDGVTKIIIKIKPKFRHINDEHLDEFKEKLTIAIHVLPEHLHLIDLQPGCTVLVYHAPLIVEMAAFPLSALQETALIGLGVIWLRCGSYRFPSDVSVLHV